MRFCPAQAFRWGDLKVGLPPCAFGERLAFIAAMSDVVNYLKCRMEIIVLNAQTGMGTTRNQYVDLCEAAVCAVKQVCLGVKKGSLLKNLLNSCTIADAPIDKQFRGELKDLFNQNLSSDPSVSLHRSTLTKVEFPENYLMQVDWAKFMNNQEDVNIKLVHLAKFWANLACNIRQRRVQRTLLPAQCSQSNWLQLLSPCVCIT